MSTMIVKIAIADGVDRERVHRLGQLVAAGIARTIDTLVEAKVAARGELLVGENALAWSLGAPKRAQSKRTYARRPVP